MKRYIHSTTDFESRAFGVSTEARNKYYFKGDVDTATGFMSGTVTKVSPYDDAEYYWARINSNGVARIMLNGEQIDKIHLWSYEEDEEDINDYFYNIILAVAEELDEFNKNVKPVMVHY